MKGYKVFTHDLCSPIQGGNPVWDGTLPYELPKVSLDESEVKCGAGWNFTNCIKTGLLIAGLWPNGRPSRVFVVEATGMVVERGDKIRTDLLTVVSEVSEDDICAAIHDFSICFRNHQKQMAESQIAWRRALSRPNHNLDKIQEGLAEALSVRGLTWELKRFESARAAWAARDAWDAWDAWAAWDAWDAWDARDAWDAWDAWAAWDARDARDARDAWDARAAWAARDAWDALTIEFAALQDWISLKPDYLVRGIRSAYENGLEIAIPTAKNELGWSEAK